MTHVLYSEDFPAAAVTDCSGPGPADEAVEHWVTRLAFTVPADDARRFLKGYGAWDAEELADDEQNLRRVFWLAMGAFSEGDACVWVGC